MRTIPATRYNHANQHNQFGIVNWFIKKGICDKEIIKEVMFVFCSEKGYEMKHIKDETKVMNFVQNRFVLFASFAAKYLKENNYTK